MTQQFLKESEKIQHEYCCTVVRLGALTPIENSDFLATTLVNGFQIVVRKDECKKGDLMIYAANETQLNKNFLSCNNLFELGERSLNKNYEEVQKLLDEGKNDEAKKLVGFFNKHGRVKCIRLRKQPSFGFLFHKESLVNWKPELKDLNLEDYIDKDFDTVCDELFVKVYVPYVPESRRRPQEPKEKGVKKIDHIIDGQFFKHFDTDQLNRKIKDISPDDVVNISIKIHGTSAIFANILCRVPKLINTRFKWFNNIVNYIHISLPEKWQKIEEKYDLIYSSRNVIQNKYIKVSRKKGVRSKYTENIWGKYAKILEPFIPEGMTVYGEIMGDTDGFTDFPDFDYECLPGESKFMPYRITTIEEGGKIREWNVCDVKKWTEDLLEEHPGLEPNIHIIDVVFEGKLTELYPHIPVDENWHENILEAMKIDARFGMEKDEPMCVHKVPREGIVLRKNDDPIKEAYKLKCVAFYEAEGKKMDKGKVDGEMIQGYVENQDQ